MSTEELSQTNKDNLIIKKRFFEAIRALVSRKQLGGIKSFATRYNLNQGNFFRLRHDDRSVIDAAYLYWLIRDFNIHSHWLMTGQGPMFAALPKTTKPDESQS
ncbi:hypothetical protein A6C57_25660 [Fibrella sp. ES10-3-2-2]|nr:hypothetical protein A6C57_25660 [Fibrella sp. ES10-3-2-2]